MLYNLKYMLKNWIAWDKKSLVFWGIKVFAMVAQPIITAYIPKVMIDCIYQGVTVNKLIVTIALLSMLVAIATWLIPFMQELLKGSGKIIRMRYAGMAFNKNLHMDYTYIESLEGRESNRRAMEFYRSDYSAAPYFIENCNQAMTCLIGVITSIVLIYKINFIVILLIIITCVGEFFLLKYFVKNEKELKTASSEIFNKFDYFYELSKDNSASKDIKIYNFSDFLISKIAKITINYENIVSKFMHQNFKVSGTRALLNLFREIISYAYLVYLVLMNQLSVSDFIFYFGIITGFSNWIVNLIYCYSEFERSCIDCSAFREFVEKEHKNADKPNVNFEEIDSIEFENVSFTYPQAEKSTINNISFKVNKGENIAIVGENGAGKTTAIKLLCGLYYPTSGDILINGKSSDDFSTNSYFDLFAVVFQDYNFLPMTIAENICITSNYDKKKLYAAFEKAGILEKINSLDKKENTLMVKDVYTDAVDFSGGEKQKLLLAKAIYKDSPILILDEPTAALDPIAENELYLKYNQLTNNKISFFISHRLSSTRFCDRILFLSDGTITESGTHEELMKLQGAYYRMYQMQSYYYNEKGDDDIE